MGNLVWNFVPGDTIEVKVCACGLVHVQVGTLSLNFSKKDFKFFQSQMSGIFPNYEFPENLEDSLMPEPSNVIQGAFASRAAHHHDSHT